MQTDAHMHMGTTTRKARKGYTGGSSLCLYCTSEASILPYCRAEAKKNSTNNNKTSKQQEEEEQISIQRRQIKRETKAYASIQELKEQG